MKHGAAEHSSVCCDKCCDMKLEWSGRAVSGVWDLALHLLWLGPDGFCQICVYRSSTTPSSTYSQWQLLIGIYYLPTIRKKKYYFHDDKLVLGCWAFSMSTNHHMWSNNHVRRRFFFTNVTERRVNRNENRYRKVRHELLQQDSRTEEEEQEDNRLCKLTGQSNWITSENHSMTWDYSAHSFCVATIIQFYDLLKLNRQGRRLAAHASRRQQGSMQKSTETLFFTQIRKLWQELGNGEHGLVGVLASCY